MYYVLGGVPGIAPQPNRIKEAGLSIVQSINEKHHTGTMRIYAIFSLFYATILANR
jgi:hypothetical protein